jgi:predicted nucleic acid-binding protein
VAAYFFDASALVKRYVAEAGTAWVRGLIHRKAGHRIFRLGKIGREVC